MQIDICTPEEGMSTCACIKISICTNICIGPIQAFTYAPKGTWCIYIITRYIVYNDLRHHSTGAARYNWPVESLAQHLGEGDDMEQKYPLVLLLTMINSHYKWLIIPLGITISHYKPSSLVIQHWWNPVAVNRLLKMVSWSSHQRVTWSSLTTLRNPNKKDAWWRCSSSSILRQSGFRASLPHEKTGEQSKSNHWFGPGFESTIVIAHHSVLGGQAISMKVVSCLLLMLRALKTKGLKATCSQWRCGSTMTSFAKQYMVSMCQWLMTPSLAISCWIVGLKLPTHLIQTTVVDHWWMADPFSKAGEMCPCSLALGSIKLFKSLALTIQ